MKTFKIAVGWKHTIIDTAMIEVEARNQKEATASALKLAETGKDAKGKEIEWSDGEVVSGSYIAGKK